jgi:putative endonuclease
MAWMAAHRDSAQGRRLRIDAIGLTGADPSTARLEHLVDVEVP